MGSKIPLLWLYPLAPSLPVDGGVEFEDNGIEDPGTTWPPPDPDRMFRRAETLDVKDAFTQPMDVDAFRKRQEADLLRQRNQGDDSTAYRRRPFHVRMEEQIRADRERDDAYEEHDSDEYAITDSEDDIDKAIHPNSAGPLADEGEESWRNSEGERLADFGVDEDAEFYDEDDLPLAELLRRRKAAGDIKVQ